MSLLRIVPFLTVTVYSDRSFATSSLPRFELRGTPAYLSRTSPPRHSFLVRTELCLQAIIAAIISRELWLTGANSLDDPTTLDRFNGTEMHSLDTRGRS
jgi:hypothetical protein